MGDLYMPCLTALENVALVTDIASAPMRPEEALARHAVEAMVKSGLAEDHQVIIYPSDAVHDGVRVKRV
jgi:hypothetical protein